MPGENPPRDAPPSGSTTPEHARTRTGTSGPQPVLVDESELVFGRYLKLRRLASGGMGEVFLAEQHAISGFRRHVILKTLLPELAQHESYVQRFLDEARVAAQLTHPGIIAIYDVGRWRGDYYIAMEYVHGATLADLLSACTTAGESLSIPVVTRVIHDAALALHHAHVGTDTAGKAMAVVHRDVTPRNIMVSLSGATRLLDFGIARAHIKPVRTATGVLQGTYPYMSPEQARGQAVDARGDQFALGVVAWELLAQRPLFHGDNDQLTIQRVLETPAPPLADSRPGIPPAVDAVVQRMLRKSAGERFPDCAAAAVALVEAAGSMASETEVAALVERLCGDQVRARLHAPSSDGDFVVALRTPHSDAPANLPGPGTIPDLPPSPAPASTPALPPPAVPGSGIQTTPERRANRGLPTGALAAAAVLLVATAALLLEQGAPPSDLSTASPGATGPTSAGSTPSAANAPPPAWTLAVEVDARAEGGLLRILEPVGGSVRVDGELRPGQVPMEFPADPGEHEVVVEHLGATARRTVTVTRSPAVVQLDSMPRGAEVFLDDVLLGQTPVSLTALKPGTAHQLVLRLQGHVAQAVEVVPRPGETVTRLVALVAQPQDPPRTPRNTRPTNTPTAADTGFVNLASEPWGRVYVGGRFVGITPLYRVELAAGRHPVRVENESKGLRWEGEVDVAPGKVTVKKVELH